MKEGVLTWFIIDYGEVIQDPQPETRASANQWLAERYRTVQR